MRGTIVFSMPEKGIHGVVANEPASVGTIAPDFELRALIAGVTTATVHDGGHFLSLDRPEELTSLIRNFIPG